MICLKYLNWNIFIENEDEEILYDMSLFILKIFNNTFGRAIMQSEKCNIMNCPTAEFPMLITNNNPITIRTSAASVNYWSQYIYQFSHELTHYAIRQKKLDKSIYIRWFEETLCEAMSLYILGYTAIHWDESPMNKINPSYSPLLESYLQDVINTKANNNLRNCKTLDELKTVDINSQEIRDNRINERNYIYAAFKKKPSNIKMITDYTKYINNDNLTIDFWRWIKAVSNDDKYFVKELQSIQPLIK